MDNRSKYWCKRRVRLTTRLKVKEQLDFAPPSLILANNLLPLNEALTTELTRSPMIFP